MSEAPSTPNQSSISRLRQRKKRKTTSCWPCRERKVKCDQSSPCDTCSKRGYPDICSLEPPSDMQSNPAARTSLLSPSTSSRIGSPVVHQEDELVPPVFQHDHSGTISYQDTVPSRALSPDDNNNSGNTLESSPLPQAHTREPFLGDNAIPSFVRDQTSAEDTETSGRRVNVEVGIMPVLGLDDTDSMYPFEPILVERMHIHDALPSDREIFKLFQSFRTQLQCFTPILSDIDEFERQLCNFVDYRSKHSSDIISSKSFSFSWLGLLYTILASGVQFSDSSNEQRSKLVHRYLQHGVQSLRFANYLIRPTRDCLQAFLVVGNVLQNATKPEAAWIWLGATARMAQSLGLHVAKKTNAAGQKLWLAVIWQDSLLSLCFDRPLATMPDVNTFSLCTLSNTMSYHEAMYSLLDYTMRGIRAKSGPDSQLQEVLSIVDQLSQIFDKTQEHLKSSENCVSFQQRCEHYALRLHVSFVAGWLCRGAFKRTRVPTSQEQAKVQLAAKGKQHLVASLRAYLSLQPLCVQASRSWAFIHNGLSSALLLGLLGETKTNPEVRQLQGALIDALSKTGDESNTNSEAESTVVLSKLHERALLALKNLYNDRSQPVGEIANVDLGTADLAAFNGQISAVHMTAGEMGQDPVSSDVVLPVPEMEMSPMEMFDSIIWDPTFGSESFPGMDTNAEQWIF